ncbi:hypothetical protein SLE2022_290850 [Rubroshorea leprosula]
MGFLWTEKDGLVASVALAVLLFAWSDFAFVLPSVVFFVVLSAAAIVPEFVPSFDFSVFSLLSIPAK